MTTEDIKKELLAMARWRLFGGGPWPAEDREVNLAMHVKLVRLGLLRDEDNGNITNTPLGAEVDVWLWSAFMGHFDTAEIPWILTERNLMTAEEEADVFERYEGGESIEDLVLPFVRRAFYEHIYASAHHR